MKLWSRNKENILHILVIDPGKAPRSLAIAHSSATLQQVVGGELEIVRVYPDGAALVCNLRGKTCELPPNRRIANGYIAGTFFVCTLGKKGFASLPSRLQKTYARRFARADKFIVVNEKVCYHPEDAIPEIFRMWSDMNAGELAVVGKIKLSV